MLDSPYIYFGAKSRVAADIWRAFGDVNCYVEPFLGSGATLLLRPLGWAGTETVNDKCSLVSNFWRALKHDPDGVASWADGPVNESDKHAQQLWIVNQLPHLADLQAGDPDHYDVKIAGWWVHGINAHIGGGFCDGKGPWKQDPATGKLAKIDDGRPGINRAVPHPGSGSGVNRQAVLKSEGGLLQWMRDLSNRLRYVVVTTGDWARIMGPSFIPPQCISGVMLDPPYSADSGRGGAVYREDDQSLAHVVRKWAIDNGGNPRIRIALCGYAGEHPMPDGWTEFRWKAVGGYGNQGDGIGRANAEREVIWFSPYCLKSGRQTGLFEEPDPIVVADVPTAVPEVTPPPTVPPVPARPAVPEISFDEFDVAPPVVPPSAAIVPPAIPDIDFEVFAPSVPVAPSVPAVPPVPVVAPFSFAATPLPSIPDIDFEVFAPSIPVAPVPAASIASPEMPWTTLAVSVAPPLLFMGAPRVEKWVAQEPPDLSNLDTIVLNFETSGLKWWDGDRPVGVAVGSLDGKLHRYLPFGHVGGGNLDEGAVIRWLQAIRGKHILNQNTRFDVHMGRTIDVDFEAQGCTVSDISHTSALLDDSRKQFALDILLADYCPDVRIVPRVDESRMASYHASEVVARAEFQVEAVAHLRRAMYPQIEEQDLRRVHDLEDRVIYPLVWMEKSGALLDLELLDVYYKECTRRHQELLWDVSKECGFAFDGKPQQWQRLFEKYGLPITHLPDPNDAKKQGKPSFTDDILKAISNPIVQNARKAAQYASLNSKTFAAYKERVDSQGILRFDLNQLRGDDGGTISGRFSCGIVQQVPNHDNHFEAFGGELFPRDLFISATGTVIAADAAQIEQRVLASLSGNPKTIAAYAADPMLSFHKMVHGMLLPYKPDLNYSHLKSLNFMKIYGGGLIKIAVMMGYITEIEGEQIRRDRTQKTDPRLAIPREIDAMYARVLPEVGPLTRTATHLAMSKCNSFCKPDDELHRKCQHRGYVKTVLGRRSRFPNDYKVYRALNRIIQGGSADVLKRKIVELHAERKHTGFLMRTTIHDEVVGDAQSQDTLSRVMEILNRQSFPEFKIPIMWTGKTAHNWAGAK